MPRRRRIGVHGIAVELIVPENVKEMAVVYLIERGAHGIRGGIAQTAAAFPEVGVGVDEGAGGASARPAISATASGRIGATVRIVLPGATGGVMLRIGRGCRRSRGHGRVWRLNRRGCLISAGLDAFAHRVSRRA